jgi:hypothetical protein
MQYLLLPMRHGSRQALDDACTQKSYQEQLLHKAPCAYNFTNLYYTLQGLLVQQQLQWP